MSSTGVRESNSNEKRIIKGLILNEGQFIQSLRVFANSSTLSGLGSTEGEINNSPKDPSGNYLSRLGDKMLGPLALSPPLDFTIEIDTNNTIDIGPLNDNAQYTSNVQLDSIQPNSFVLDIIANAAFDGQLLFLRTFAPTVPFTISQGTLGNGGNIQTGDGNDLTVGDLQIVTLIFDEALKIGINTGGSWRVLSISSSTGGGSNVPDGTIENQKIEWDDVTKTWVAVEVLTMGSTGPFADSGFLRFANDQIIFSARNNVDTGNLELKVDASNRFDFTDSNEQPVQLQLRSQHATQLDQLFQIRQFSGTGAVTEINVPNKGMFQTAGAVDVFSYDDATGLKIEGTHVINMNKNIINTIGSTQWDRTTTFTPTAIDTIGFDTATMALKYNVALTTDIHRFQAAGELLASITRIGSNIGSLIMNGVGGSVQASILQANQQLFLATFNNVTPSNGDVWRDSGTGNFQFRENGVTVGLGGAGATELDDLTDVTISTPVNDQRLIYDAGGGVWRNQNAEGLETLSFMITSPQAGEFGDAEVWYSSRVNATRRINESGSTDDFFANVSPGVDVVFFIPFIASREFTFNALAIHAVVGTGSTNLSIGMYESDPDTLEPTNLIVASNNFALASGDNVRTTGNISRPPGLYFLAYKQETSPAPGSLKIRAIEPDGIAPVLGFERGESGFNLGDTSIIGYTGDFTTTGMPSTFTSTSNEAKLTAQTFSLFINGPPEIFIRITSFGL